MKTVVITGAGGVLCSGFAKTLAADGNRVALLGIKEDELIKIQKEIADAGHVAKYYVADVTDEDSMKKAHDEIFEDFGECDILINGAGGNHPLATTEEEYINLSPDEEKKDFFSLDKKGFSFVFDLNLWGTVLPCQVFAEDMKKKGGGCILNISSMAAFSPLTKTPAYSAAKAGISNFTQWLSVHLAPAGIRVNAIAPGFFITTQNKDLLIKDDGTLSPRAEKIIRNTPMKRFGEPEELIGAVKFLLDDEKAGFITGCVMPIDGGFSAYSGV